MNFFSTRNKSKANKDINCILKGLADDGGLFVPADFPELKLENLVDKNYIDMASYITSLFFESFTYDELKEIYSLSYKDKFQVENMIDIKSFKGYGFIELFHGPTSAFKDMALQALPNFVDKSKEKFSIDKETVILTATSGDTGSAAIRGFESIENLKIIVLYPTSGVSEIQKKQMTTSSSPNTYVLGIDGNFDDAQKMVKAILNDTKLKEVLSNRGIEFSSANSINIGRLVPQIVYYVYSYLELVRKNIIKLGEEINVSVPTGNFGNILAAYYSKRMGLPIKKLVCASNKNNVLSDFISTGIYNRERDFYKTNSPSMDILVSSNLERFLFHTSDNDDNYVSGLMKDLSNKGFFEVNKNHFNKLENLLSGYWVDEKSTEKLIGDLYKEEGYLMDPHTAIGYYGYLMEKEQAKSSPYTLIAATASPYKFPESICSSLNIDCPDSAEKMLKAIENNSNTNIPENLLIALNKEEIHKGTNKTSDIYDKIKSILGVE
jgi:threonine synthase